MKHALALFLLMVLFSTAAFAVEDNPTTKTSMVSGIVSATAENQTNFGSVGVWGGATGGNPGYIALKSTDGTSSFAYYLWVNQAGNLMIASYPNISTYASFPTGNWAPSTMGGSKVGSQ